MAQITFERSFCCDLNKTSSREWLVTNGLGGYAAGTVAGVLTRMQHGLLVSSPIDGTPPQLLLAKIDEEVVFNQRTYYLGTNEYQDGTLHPSGFVHLETFRLEEGFPIFTYRLGGMDGIMLEKRIWMPRGYNTTYIQYRVLRTAQPFASVRARSEGNGGERRLSNGLTARQRYLESAQQSLTLTLLPFSAYRPYDQPQYGNNELHFQVETYSRELGTRASEQQLETRLPKGVAGCTIRAWDGAHPYHILAVGPPESATTFIPAGVWYWRFLRRHDQVAGLPATDDLYLPGVIRSKLWPSEDSLLTIIVSAEELSVQTFSPSQLNLSYKCSVEQQRTILRPQRYFGEGGETAHQLRVLPFSTTSDPYGEGEKYLRLLLQASDRFFIHHSRPDNPFTDAESIPCMLSGYYGMEASTRDTLIALPGLSMATGRYDEARLLLRGFARYFRQGLLPDRLPTGTQPLEESDYGNVDTTLWYFYALDHYLRVTGNYQLLYELYHRLVESISWYMEGTYNGIRVDTKNGLLHAQQPGKALTWMNATIDAVPVTPREGKPVEVNALWYHALSLMHEWSQLLYQAKQINYTTSHYKVQSGRCRRSFQERFWYAAGNYLYDVIDGSGGNDSSIRPNQLFAVSLRYPVLDEEYRLAVFDVVTQQLLTPYGIRTLAPHEAHYQGHLKDKQEDQQRALHQGSAWPWLIGPYVDAWLCVQGSANAGHTVPIGTIHRAPMASNKGTQSPRLHSHQLITTNLDRERMLRKGIEMLEPLREQFSQDMLGMIGGTFDGDALQSSGDEVASALSTAEMLRVYNLLVQADMVHAGQVVYPHGMWRSCPHYPHNER